MNRTQTSLQKEFNFFSVMSECEFKSRKSNYGEKNWEKVAHLMPTLVLTGDKMANIFAAFPIMYLSGGTCVALIIIGGGTMKTFYQIACGASCHGKPMPLTTVEWYLVFTCAAVLLSQLPNLNSIAGVSLVGAITAIGYCTIMWIVSVTEDRLDGVSYDRVRPVSNVVWIFGILNSYGIIAFAFRGHNLTLEIQVPSTLH